MAVDLDDLLVQAPACLQRFDDIRFQRSLKCGDCRPARLSTTALTQTLMHLVEGRRDSQHRRKGHAMIVNDQGLHWRLAYMLHHSHDRPT